MSSENKDLCSQKETGTTCDQSTRRDFLGRTALAAASLSALGVTPPLAAQASAPTAQAGKEGLEKRLALILHRLETEALATSAARIMAEDGGYCDFFVENNDGGPFHEKCPNDRFLGLQLTKDRASPRRMQELSKFRAASTDCYPDFFVEGSGPPWHERIDDYGIREQLVRPEQRIFALRRSNVLQTFTRIAEGVRRETR